MKQIYWESVKKIAFYIFPYGKLELLFALCKEWLFVQSLKVIMWEYARDKLHIADSLFFSIYKNKFYFCAIAMNNSTMKL